MRLALSVVAAAAVVACGNYSNLQIEFIEALPTSSQVHVSIPQPAGGQALCSTQSSDALAAAQDAGGAINGGIETVLNLVDFVITLPPTKRETDELIWGPVTDSNHPLFDDMVTMSEEDGGVSYDFEVERRGTTTWTPLITGQFSGGSAATGSGNVTLHFDNSTALGIADPGDPNLPLTVSYDLASDPQTIDLSAQAAGLSLLAFDYHYQLASEGSGQFVFETTDGAATITWTIDFQKDGSGTSEALGTSGTESVTVYESWDSSACINCLDDPDDFTNDPECAPQTTCVIGDGGTCGAG